LHDAFQHGFGWRHGLELIAHQEDGPSTYHFSSALKATCDVLRETHSAYDPLEELAAIFIDVKWRVEVVEETVRLLVDGYEVANASELAVSWAKLYLNSHPDLKSRISNTIGTVLLNHADKHWDELWPLVSDSDALRHGVLSYFAWMDHREKQLLSMLAVHQIAALYAQLVAEFSPLDDPEDIRGVHQVTFRESIGRWRDSVLRHLASRGTWEAVEALDRLQSQLPAVDWIVVETERAREQARLGTWTPPSGIELMEIARTPSRRFVSNASQLLKVVLESLERLEQKLQASEPPRAIDLWNEVRSNRKVTYDPKDEERLSDYIKAHLDDEFREDGVVINREVVNRRGEETDIRVETFVRLPNGHESD